MVSLATPLLDVLGTQDDLAIGDNEPYSGHLPGDSIDRHAIAQNRPNALIELRNDLIADHEQQHNWADRLAPLLLTALAKSGL